MKSIKIKSTVSCPECGETSVEAMPTGACQFFWECPHCKTVLKPKKGDCCVYCSYGDTPCPPEQSAG